MGRTAKTNRNYRRRYKKRRTKYGGKRKYAKPFSLSARKMDLPDRMFVKLRYIDNDQNEINIPQNDAFGIRRLSGNNIYDPDLNTGNYGVLGYTEWSNFYNKYRVHASKIRVTFAQRSTQGQVNENHRFRCTVLPLDLSSNPSTLNFFKGQPMQQYAKTREISAIVGGHNQITISNYMSMCKFEGSMAPKYDISFAATTHGSATNQSPQNQFYWFIIVASLDGNLTTAGYDLGCTVSIDYYVEYYSRRDLSANLTLLEFPDDNYVPDDNDEAGEAKGATGQTGMSGDDGGQGATGATGATGP